MKKSDLEKISFGLGFRDPNEFKAFSLDFSRQMGEEYTETSLAASFESTLGSFMIRNTTTATWQDSDFAGVDNTFHAAHEINDTWTAIAGTSMSYDAMNNQFNAIPQLGVQYKDIPLTVGWDFEAKGVVFGITIPFGRRR